MSELITEEESEKVFSLSIKSERNACQNRFLITLITASLTRCY